MLKDRCRTERGSVIIEFALLLPIFLLLFAGVIEVGKYYWEQHVLSAAAREGARAASMSKSADITGVVKNYVSNYGSIDAGSVDVNLTTEPLPGDAENTLEVVTVTKPYDFFLLPRLMLWMQEVTIMGRAKMIKEI
jgi:Flp pilus assembly protein TadG